MYTINNTSIHFSTQSIASYAGIVSGILTPYALELFSPIPNEYQKLIVELNTASQHLLIEIDRMAGLERALTAEEHDCLMSLYDRQITAQATLQQHLHNTYDSPRPGGGLISSSSGASL